ILETEESGSAHDNSGSSSKEGDQSAEYIAHDVIYPCLDRSWYSGCPYYSSSAEEKVAHEACHAKSRRPWYLSKSQGELDEMVNNPLQPLPVPRSEEQPS